MAVFLFGLEHVHIAVVVVAAAAAERTARIDYNKLHWDGEANEVALVEAAASQHDAGY